VFFFGITAASYEYDIKKDIWHNIIKSVAGNITYLVIGLGLFAFSMAKII
jgi:hypothetical protein